MHRAFFSRLISALCRPLLTVVLVSGGSLIAPAVVAQDFANYLQSMGLPGLLVEHRLADLRSEKNGEIRREQVARTLEELTDIVFDRSRESILPDPDRVEALLQEFSVQHNPVNRLLLAQLKFRVSFASWLTVLGRNRGETQREQDSRHLQYLIREVEETLKSLEESWPATRLGGNESDRETLQQWYLRASHLLAELRFLQGVLSNNGGGEIDLAHRDFEKLLGGALPWRLADEDTVWPNPGVESDLLTKWFLCEVMLRSTDRASQSVELLKNKRSQFSQDLLIQSMLLRSIVRNDSEPSPNFSMDFKKIERENQIVFVQRVAEYLHFMPIPLASEFDIQLARQAMCYYLSGELFEPADKHPVLVELACRDPLISQWVKTRESLERYRSEETQATLAQARLQALLLLDMSFPENDSEFEHARRSLLTEIFYWTGDYQKVVALVDESSPQDKELGFWGMERMGWFRARSLYELSRVDPTFVERATNQIRDYRQQFPGTQLSDSLRLDEWRMRYSAFSAKDAVAEIAGHSAQNALHWGLSLVLLEEFERLSRESPTVGSDEVVQFLKQVDKAWAQIEGDASCPENVKRKAAGLRLKLGVVWDADVAYLTTAETDLQSFLDPELGHHPVDDQYLATLVASAAQRKDWEAAERFARTLVANSNNPEFLEVAYLALIKVLSDRLASAHPTSGSQTPLKRELIQLYQKWLLPLSKDSLNGSAVRQAGVLKLAELQSESGDWKAALPCVEILLELSEDQVAVLSIAARVYQKLDQSARALELYRKVAAGTTIGSSEWLEAKAGIVEVLAPADGTAAKAVYQQVLDRYPDLPPEWQERFLRSLNSAK